MDRRQAKLEDDARTRRPPYRLPMRASDGSRWGWPIRSAVRPIAGKRGPRYRGRIATRYGWTSDATAAADPIDTVNRAAPSGK